MSYLEKRNKLPNTLREFIISDAPRYEIEKTCFIYGLSEEVIKTLSYPIALIFIGELKLKDYPAIIAKDLKQPEQVIFGIAYEINQRIFARFPDFFKDSLSLLEEWSNKKSNPLISESEAWKKVLELEPWILEEEREKIKEKRAEDEIIRKQQSQLENMPIELALEKYPELGEQLITSNHIKLKVFPEPVRPSIKNWLSDYTFTVGISNHDPIVRGNYLFKSENGRPLSSQDREKLTAILKSFEEKTPISINGNTKQVVFAAPEKREIPQRPTMNPGATRNNFEPAEIQRGQGNYPTRQTISGGQQRFQTDEERIAAWRRDLPQKEALRNGNTAENIKFSSPQTFSTEKSPEIPKPLQKNYPAPTPIARINYSTPRPMPKNVVDLKNNDQF